MDILTDLGIGLAIGMLAGTAGTHGSARGRMMILAAVIGLAIGFVVDGLSGALVALVGAALGCIVLSDIVYGASRREGSGGGALAFIIGLAALVVLAIALLAPILIVVVVVAEVYLGVARHRRAQRKHAGLRVLR